MEKKCLSSCYFPHPVKSNVLFVHFMNFIASLLTKSEIKRKIGRTWSEWLLCMVMFALGNKYV